MQVKPCCQSKLFLQFPLTQRGLIAEGSHAGQTKSPSTPAWASKSAQQWMPREQYTHGTSRKWCSLGISPVFSISVNQRWCLSIDRFLFHESIKSFLNRSVMLLSTAFCDMKTYELTLQNTERSILRFVLDLATAGFLWCHDIIMTFSSALYCWSIAEKNYAVVTQLPKINGVPFERQQMLFSM